MAEEFYRVTMIKSAGDSAETWTNYFNLGDAIDAASGLLTSKAAIESEIIWVRAVGDESPILRLILDRDGNITKKK